MNHYAGRRRAEAPVWDYTRRNDNQIVAVGFCSQDTLCPAAAAQIDAHSPFYRCPPECEQCHGALWVRNPDHCGGHSTEDEASECFARYLLAQGSIERTLGEWHGCEAIGADGEKCDEPTKVLVDSKHPLGHSLALCDEHRAGDAWTKQAPTSAGRISASY